MQSRFCGFLDRKLHMIALLETLKGHPPFSFLDDTAFALIERNAQIAYYPNHTVLTEPNFLFDKLFVIIKGMVEVNNDDELIDVYRTHDAFGGIELLKNQASLYQYKVTEELICYEIKKEVFLKLCESNKAFKDYFFSSIVERLEMLKEKREYTAMSDLMMARVDKSILHNACVLASDMPIIDSLKKMEECNATSVIVKNPQGYGIVTDADLRYYILYQQSQELHRLSDIQSYPVISIEEGELLFNILLLMTERTIKHLPVLDKTGEVLGVLELIDLLSFFSNQSHLISAQMEKASTLEAVIDAAKRVEIMISALHAKGVKSRYIAKLVSEINKKMYLRLFEMIFPKSWHEKCTLILLGSEGRGEQILRTDQDNALIFEEGFLPDNIEEITQKFILALDNIGFPRCSGNIMVINPQWRKSIDGYKNDIDSWVEGQTHEGFINMAILFDSVAIAGEKNLHTQLREYLIEKMSGYQSVLAHFAKPIEHFESALGLFSQFVTGAKEHQNEIDIKKGALFALVHGVRALALEHAIEPTNTILRIKALNNIGFMNKEDASELIEAFEVINTLRLHSQLEKSAKGKKIDNYISIVEIGKLERDLLKEAIKSVHSFKKMISYHFHLSMVG